MRILSIESSGKIASVALTENDNTIAEVTLGDRLTHSQTLLPMVDMCMELAEMSMDSVDYFACDIGPGSFTGLRIGIATINAFALSMNKKIIGVNSLHSLAANLCYSERIAVPMIDARNGRIFCAKYDVAGNLPQEIVSPYASNISDFFNEIDSEEEYIFIGSGVTANGESIVSNMAFDSDKIKIVRGGNSFNKAVTIGVIAYDMACKGLAVDELKPLYLRASQAEQVRDNKVG